jgi:hypothetical protein
MSYRNHFVNYIQHVDCIGVYVFQGSPHIVTTGRLDFSLSWLKGQVRENLGDFRKSIQILTFPFPLPHIPLPFTKTNNDLKRMQLTSLE